MNFGAVPMAALFFSPADPVKSQIQALRKSTRCRRYTAGHFFGCLFPHFNRGLNLVP
jgi:hypothetical protein